MEKGLFQAEAMVPGARKWEDAISRAHKLYSKKDEIRTEFERDYTRILHSLAYRRLKHKTQVFFATTNDHVCTRIEHVNHVSSISRTIATFLGLNHELTDAISLGHDLGHAPFGHKGEEVLKRIVSAGLPGRTFWHEKNSLRFVDSIEILEGPEGKYVNLDLTYAVRDGIVCHCGEVDDHKIIPREDKINLYDIEKASQVQPYTWEGCVVKVSDKIAYLGRDIEDALNLNILKASDVDQVDKMLSRGGFEGSLRANNTVLIHCFIVDLCKESSIRGGICFSQNAAQLMKDVKDFCYEKIYRHKNIERYKLFVERIINGLFEVLMEMVDAVAHDQKNLCDELRGFYPSLFKDFEFYLSVYSVGIPGVEEKYAEIEKVYNLKNVEDRIIACIDFISGMTDQYAIKKFKETITF
ncbi:deoxyguanosinetriphosphate triphosphohydrolase family protein [Desulfocurvus vexinensis]|uniref:deoxyguanosinetriphosphate triphosphohydrolase family protein n=1 Tax=Desulfocurvus vexinensis TaxID=399548 RepID=UPI0004AF6E5A|nr:HD domain-containing protein [Desulfocurvus vexinensis]